MNTLKLFLESPDFLRTIVTEAEKNNETARYLVAGLSDSQLNWKPSPKVWSIAQCLQHLTIASSEFERYFTKAIEQARTKRPVSAPLAYRPSMIGGWLIKQLVPETTRKAPAPKIFRPAESSSIHDALGSFLKQQERFLGFVRESEGIDYNRARLRSPVTPLMRYSLADAFVVTIVHEQRHLGQGRRICELPGFPA